MKEVWEDKGRWHAKYKHNYTIVATEAEAINRVRGWKGLSVKATAPAPAPEPAPEPVVEEREKIAGAIVEESILEADTNDDGVLTKEEIADWVEKDG